MTDSTVRERPILFSGPMVRQILSGNKTQTRRVIKPQPEHKQVHVYQGKTLYDEEHRMFCWKSLVLENIWDFPNNDDRKILAAACPYGSVGDVLWVKETHALESWTEFPDQVPADGRPVLRVDRDEWQEITVARYRATEQADLDCSHERCEGGPCLRPWRPSIHMPKWASRVRLQVIGVKVERLNEVTESDALAEGIHEFKLPNGSFYGYDPMGTPGKDVQDTARNAFAKLWENINFERGFGWNTNPFVWVIAFRRI